MKDIGFIIKTRCNDINSIFNNRYRYIFYRERNVRRVMNIMGLLLLPITVIFKFLKNMLGELIKLRVIGRPFRLIKALFSMLTWVKRIEELEKKILILEKEHSSLKRQWFNS